MLPAAHVKRVRVQSVSNDNDFERDFETQNFGNENFINQKKRTTLAQACSEATYNSALNVDALNEAVRQNPSLIVLKTTKDEKFHFRVSLKNIRRVLLLANLIVLATAGLSYAAWSTVNNVKNAHLDHKGSKHHVWIHEKVDPLVALVLPYMDRALFTFSNYLMLYYLVFGCGISMFFGGPTDILFIVLLSPIVLILCLVLISVSISVIYFRSGLDKNLDQLMHPSALQHISFHLQKSLCELHQILDAYGIPFAALSVLTSLVQAAMAILPWFVYDLPFQRMLDIEDMVIHDIENRQVSSYPKDLVKGGGLRSHALTTEKGSTEKKTRPSGNEEEAVTRRPYRTMTSAYTVLLQLCKPGTNLINLQDIHIKKNIFSHSSFLGI